LSGTHKRVEVRRRKAPDPERIAAPITIGRGFNWSAGRLF